jgi:hypothetical protein
MVRLTPKRARRILRYAKRQRPAARVLSQRTIGRLRPLADRLTAFQMTRRHEKRARRYGDAYEAGGVKPAPVMPGLIAALFKKMGFA